MKNYLIKSIVLSVHDTSYGGYPYVATVNVEVDAKYWSALKKKNQLGMLYGVDISNEVYRLSSQLIPAHNPMVDHNRNAKNGIKTISLQYHFKDHDKAEKLGMKVLRMKNGECLPSYNCRVEVYSAAAPKLRAVVTEYQGANALNRIFGK